MRGKQECVRGRSHESRLFLEIWLRGDREQRLRGTQEKESIKFDNLLDLESEGRGGIWNASKILLG